MGCEQSEPTEPYYPQSFHRKPVLFFALGGPGSGKASYQTATIVVTVKEWLLTTA